jgi:hypothetical protein
LRLGVRGLGFGLGVRGVRLGGLVFCLGFGLYGWYLLVGILGVFFVFFFFGFFFRYPEYDDAKAEKPLCDVCTCVFDSRYGQVSSKYLYCFGIELPALL